MTSAAGVPTSGWIRSFWAEATRHRLETVASLSMIIFGAYFLIPGAGLNAFTRNQASVIAYGFMSNLMPEWGWGAAFVTSGAISRLGIAIKNRQMRVIGMLLVTFWRGFLLISLGSLTNWSAGQLADHLSGMLIAFWAFWRIEP